MKSFGLWYLPEDNNQDYKKESPKFDLHINFWDLKDSICTSKK